jgi:hypothetical protein
MGTIVPEEPTMSAFKVEVYTHSLKVGTLGSSGTFIPTYQTTCNDISEDHNLNTERSLKEIVKN